MTASPRREPVPIGRIEAFSDGVFAVAITLLVLDLRVPEPDGSGSLAARLLDLWPNYLAYVISFSAIGIMWINHHTMLRRLHSVDHSVLVLNLALLLCIAVLPFTTALIATYLDAATGGHLAAAVYAGSLLVTSLVFLGLQHHLHVRRSHLLRDAPSTAQRRAILRRAALAPPGYLVAGAVGFISPLATLAVCVVMGIAFLFPPPGARRGAPLAGSLERRGGQLGG